MDVHKTEESHETTQLLVPTCISTGPMGTQFYKGWESDIKGGDGSLLLLTLVLNKLCHVHKPYVYYFDNICLVLIHRKSCFPDYIDIFNLLLNSFPF